jgi:threonine aldolase
MKSIDLRSDTVTKPTPAMREAMMRAPVGDDVFSEDPSIIELETYCAALLGKGAALFCPSGTMTNQIAIKVHTQPGDEVICDVNSHIFNYEGGGIAFNSGVQARLITGSEGRLTPELIAPAINGDYDWLAHTSLVSLENTVNRAGGSYYTLKQMSDVSIFCHEKGLKLHLDGARLFNAVTETGDNLKEIGKLFNSISICLSKGLGAPVGSLLIGDKAFIRKARRIRKLLGGGMRQGGILAAGGLFALQNHVKRLKEDHARARSLGDVLKSLPYVESVLPVYTNIVIFKLNPELMPADGFEKKLASMGIRVSPFGKQTVRMVTHYEVDDEMIRTVADALREMATVDIQ